MGAEAMQAERLCRWVTDARSRTLELVDDLSDEQLQGQPLATVNPLLWEIGHVAWFQEKWVLRHFGRCQPLCAETDHLYDSAAIAHETRWDLPLFSRQKAWRYLADVHDRVLDLVASTTCDPKLSYFVKLSVFHEDMHAEAFTYMRQTLGFPPPPMAVRQLEEPQQAAAGSADPDVEHPGGTFLLGSGRNEPFVFDNEKWAHPVQVKPFAIARTPVTQFDFARFVDDAGYQRRGFWSDAGWQWRSDNHPLAPVYWQRDPAAQWLRRDYDRWVRLEPDRPVVHVNAFEAEAYCRWAGRRLATEAEWELAAAADIVSGAGLGQGKRRYPWGNQDPDPQRTNVDGYYGDPIGVHALPAGDTPRGCRQMMGNVWEWTASDFGPYPGFVPDPYKEYSKPWFGTRRVLRGGCWATRARLLRNTWRNFFPPDRRDLWAGFRTCRVDG